MTVYLNLLRVKHYIKNIFILMPLFFSGQFLDEIKLLNAFLAFIAFCFAASAVYILNDYVDIESDRLHENKKLRPLASGLISVKSALVVFILLLALSFSISLYVGTTTALLLIIYCCLNLAYSYYLKNIALIDVNIIAIGFVIRLFVGATACSLALSHWIVVMTFLLALFLGMAKRRDDVIIFEKTGLKMRKGIDAYTRQFLDHALTLLGGIVIVTYLIYVTSPEVVSRLGSEYLYLNSIFVILGVLRYLYRILVLEDSSSPTNAVYKDRALQLTIVLWLSSFIGIIYL